MRQHIEHTEGAGDWCETTEDCATTDYSAEAAAADCESCSGPSDRGDDGEWLPSDTEDSIECAVPMAPRTKRGAAPYGNTPTIQCGTQAVNLLDDEESSEFMLYAFGPEE